MVPASHGGETVSGQENCEINCTDRNSYQATRIESDQRTASGGRKEGKKSNKQKMQDMRKFSQQTRLMPGTRKVC